MIQTTEVIKLLQDNYPDIEFQVIGMTTIGDKILDVALNKIGEKSLFTKELEVGLEQGQVDFVVHSLKDLPTKLPDNLVIAAILQRETPEDVVVFKSGLNIKDIKDLNPGGIVGTTSVRRRAQLGAKFPHLEFKYIRGNLNTRLKKLDKGSDFDAIVLAAAGLKRMDLHNRISQTNVCIHAVGQGALPIECRQGDEAIMDLVWGLTHRETLLACISERAVLSTLEGGCSAPVACHAELKDDGFYIIAGAWSLDGQQKVVKENKVLLDDVVTEKSCPNHLISSVYPPSNVNEIMLNEMAAAEMVGNNLALEMLREGADVILQKAKAQNQASVLK